MAPTTRPFADIARGTHVLIVLSLALQVAVHWLGPKPQARAEDLARAPSESMLRAASQGEPVAAAKWLMLRLQAYDNQPGISIPFLSLDYGRVIAWLERILALDPQSQYPLLSASRLYGEVPDPVRQRQMLDFVFRKFLEDPNRRWPWLAHAVIIARHRLKDMPLARTYAEALRTRATGPDVPHWVQQMDILLLADMNEVESARVLLGGLLASGQVTDQHEFHFLNERLKELDAQPTAAPSHR
jgi:hypothetical protein